MDETQGNRLRRLRTEKGLTQKALGKLAGVGQTAIANIEADSRGYGLSVVAIAQALGTTPEYLQLEKKRIQTAYWPFESFSPDQYNQLDKALRDEIEDRLLGAILRQQRANGTHG
jgi:transcriptional regulator with XRE-family HTH domain